MSDKLFRPRKLAYHWFIWVVVFILMVSATGCGQDATATPVSIVPPGPTDTVTPQPTSTPRPTPTPTELPIVLPTATPPQAQLPSTAPPYEIPLTQPNLPSTATARATPTLPPSATPYVPPQVVSLGIFSYPQTSALYRPDYIPPPGFSTSCIVAQHFRTPTPTPTPTPTVLVTVNSTVQIPTPTPQLNSLAPAEANAWLASFQTRYYADARSNSVLVKAPTFTPYPTNTPLPTLAPTQAPVFNTPDVFTGQTPIPVNTANGAGASPTPTQAPRVPTFTPAVAARFRSLADPFANSIGSVYITDVVALLNGYTEQPITFAAMWQVMNDVSLALANPDTPIETYLRAYEQSLDRIIGIVLNRSLADPRLGTTGEQRYANRKIIIGNVPNLMAFRYYTPCFTAQRLQQVQNDYNQLINRMAAKYSGRVFVADMNTLNWMTHPQWVATEDGLRLTAAGADAVADVFGAVFLKLNL